jgi:hypothetical protein
MMHLDWVRTRRAQGVVRGAMAALLFFCGDAAHSHHSVQANFDMRKTVEVTGKVTAIHIRNPHSQYVLEASGTDGKPVEWLLEWSDRNALIRRKVAIDTIKVGDTVTVTAWPSRTLDHVGFFLRAVLPDGSIFRDCGFREFREAVVKSKEFTCEDAAPKQDAEAKQ